MQIRAEAPGDRQAVHALVMNAFGRGQEAGLVNKLRTDGDLIVSLVAEHCGGLCGHVALSRLKSPEGALALAPVSVSANEQKRGIGTALIREALRRAKELGSDIIFVLGEPSYYSRFGFSVETAEQFPCAYAGPYFMALQLTDSPSSPAPVVYADAFATLE